MDERDLALKLWVVLSRSFQAVRLHATDDQERHSLSEGEFAVLEALHHKGPMLLVEVQRKVLVSSGGITYLVDRLVRKGLVERRACATDRRASYAALTPAGEALIAGIFPEHAEAMVQATAGLDSEEKRQCIELLKRLGRHAADAPTRADRAPVPATSAEARTSG